MNIAEINEEQKRINKHKERDFSDYHLDIIWKYLIDYELPVVFPERSFSFFLKTCEINHDEYGYCIKRISGENSYKDFLENTNATEWNKNKYALEGNEKRDTKRDIVKIYERRGDYNYSDLDYRKTDKEKEMLNPNYSLNYKYVEKAKRLLQKKAQDLQSI